MTWLISSWMSLGLNGFGAGSVFSDPPSSSVEQKTKLVPFNLSFPIKKTGIWWGVLCKAKASAAKRRSSHFLPCRSSSSWFNCLTWHWQLFTWDNPNTRISFYVKIFAGVNLTPGGHPLFWAFLVRGQEKKLGQFIPLITVSAKSCRQAGQNTCSKP